MTDLQLWHVVGDLAEVWDPFTERAKQIPPSNIAVIHGYPDRSCRGKFWDFTELRTLWFTATHWKIVDRPVHTNLLVKCNKYNRCLVKEGAHEMPWITKIARQLRKWKKNLQKANWNAWKYVIQMKENSTWQFWKYSLRCDKVQPIWCTEKTNEQNE